MMRKKCPVCKRSTYSADEEEPLFCVYCGEDLTKQPFLPLGNFKPYYDGDRAHVVK